MWVWIIYPPKWRPKLGTHAGTTACSEGFALHSLFCRRRYTSARAFISLYPHNHAESFADTLPLNLLSFNAKRAQCLQTHGLFTEPYVYPQNVPCIFQTLSIHTSNPVSVHSPNLPCVLQTRQFIEPYSYVCIHVTCRVFCRHRSIKVAVFLSAKLMCFADTGLSKYLSLCPQNLLVFCRN